VDSDAGVEIVFAAERLLPARGGAELFALELLSALSVRHRVRAIFVSAEATAVAEACPSALSITSVADPARRSMPYWLTRRTRADALAAHVRKELDRRPADVVVTQLHAAPAVHAAAGTAPTVIMLPSYEALCKYAFDAGSSCPKPGACAVCPRVHRLSTAERGEFLSQRGGHMRALGGAALLLAPSHAMASACVMVCGRRPEVVPAVIRSGATAPSAPAIPLPAGSVVFAAARWDLNKGAQLLAPIAARLSPQRVVVYGNGLDLQLRAGLERLRNVSVHGYAPRAQFLSGAAVLLVPSQWPEAFGRVAFEGLAAGIPTLASAIGGLTEFVPSAQLVRAYDSADAWERAVRALEEPCSWAAAQEHGLVAVKRLLSTNPAADSEALIVAAVGRARRSSRMA
jgi:glycosyltransferase involved in cell wall biosynthesis